MAENKDHDEGYPEGFDSSCGIPAKYMREANQALASLSGKREWDVGVIGRALHAAATEAVNVFIASQGTPGELVIPESARPKIQVKSFEDHRLVGKQLEAAARKLCELRGQDPDKDVGHGAESDSYGVVCDILLYSKRWQLVADEIRKLDQNCNTLFFGDSTHEQ
jgi:hypothetical protein